MQITKNTKGCNSHKPLRRQQQCKNSEIVLQLVSDSICCQLSNERWLQVSHRPKLVLHGLLMTLVAVWCGGDVRMKPSGRKSLSVDTSSADV